MDALSEALNAVQFPLMRNALHLAVAWARFELKLAGSVSRDGGHKTQRLSVNL